MDVPDVPHLHPHANQGPYVRSGLAHELGLHLPKRWVERWLKPPTRVSVQVGVPGKIPLALALLAIPPPPGSAE
jgi:hypothetical protein